MPEGQCIDSVVYCMELLPQQAALYCKWCKLLYMLPVEDVPVAAVTVAVLRQHWPVPLWLLTVSAALNIKLLLTIYCMKVF